MTTSTSSSQPHGKNAFAFVLVTVAIDMLAFGVIIPVIPALIRELANVPSEEATLYLGALAATYALMNFLFGPVLGALSDRFGRRPVLLASVATLAVDFLIMGLAHSIWLLFIGRALSGISGATLSTANAYIADTTSIENRGRAFGLVGAAFGLGFIFGPVIGGLLGDIDPRAPFLASAALCALNFLYGLLVLPESLPSENRRAFNIARANPLGAARHFAKLPKVVWFLIASGIFAVAHTVYPSTWSVHGEIRYDWSPREIGISLGIVGVGAAVIQAGLMGWILKRIGTVRTAVLGLCSTAISLIGFSMAGMGWMAYAIIPISSLGGLSAPATNSLMSIVTPADAQGELQGAIASINALAMIFGPLLMNGILFSFTHDGATFHFGGAAFLLAALLTVICLIPFQRGVIANRDALPAATEQAG